ncbi:MAG: hypothetical protein R3279_09005 [Putridiphycobacter sp.]|nr:hypothetical protein [Putridiphycobacter sp.]
MRKIIAFILLFNTTISSAQNSTTVLENIDSDASLIGFSDETSVFLTEIEGGAFRSDFAKSLGYKVLFFNNYSNTLSSQKDLLSSSSSFNFNIIKSIDKSNEINVFCSDFDRKNKEIEISTINISKNNKSITESQHVVGFPIDNVPFLIVVGQPRRFYTSDLIKGPKLANDGKTTFGTVLYGKSSTKAKVFTVREGEATEMEIQLPASCELFEVIEQECDDNGNVFILGYIKTSKEDTDSSIDRKKVYLIKVDFKTKKIRKMLVNSGKSVKTMSMLLSRDGRIFIAGLGHTNNIVNSYFSFLYSSNLQLQKRNVGEINEESFLNSFTTTEKSIFKGTKENEYFYNFKKPIIIENENGSFSSFTEQYYNIERTVTSFGSDGSTYKNTIYEEYTVGIIGLHFDTQGIQTGSSRLNTGTERQVLSPNDDRVKDFGVYLYKGRGAVIFQHSSVNELDGMKINSFSRGTQLLRATLNENGSFSEEVVYELPDYLTTFIAYTSNIKLGEDNSIAISGKNGDPSRKKEPTIKLLRDDEIREGGTFVLLIE